MELTGFFNLLFSFFSNIYYLLNSKVVFNIFGYWVSLASIIGALLILGFVITIFWKGAKA